MFKQRLLTTLVLLPLFLAMIYYAPAWMLAGILLFLLAMSGWEWTKLIALERLEHRLSFIIVLLLMVWVGSHGLGIWLGLGFMCWIAVLVAVVAYPASQAYWGYPIVVALVGLLFLSNFTNVFIRVYQSFHGQDLIIYVMSLIWAADIGAYLVGNCWGRHKLIPQVSPGKTIEGSAGGCILSLLVGLVGYFIFRPDSIILWFSLALMTALISILGDLLISMLKRRSQLKDSGHILPGHGGILDRLDSSIAALPLFYCVLTLMEIGR